MVMVQKDISVLVDEAVNDRSKLRKIVSLLYDSDMEVRLSAAKALGQIAKIKPEYIRQVWHRILNATDDTMSCWGVSEGLGEIARNLPDLRGKILIRLMKFRRDESTCQGFLWAVCRIGQVDRERIKEFIPNLVGFLDSGDACMVGQVIWALGELGVTETRERILGFLNDERETWIYENDAPVIKSVGRIAEEAVRKLEAA